MSVLHNSKVTPSSSNILMLERGYIILIAGALLFAIGIGLVVGYGTDMATILLDETTILDNIELEPAEPVNKTLDIESTDRPVSVVLYVESGVNGDNSPDSSNQSPADRPVVEQIVISPDGKVINKNQISENTQSDLLATFMPESEGTYTLTLTNLGTERVSVFGFFGFLPIIEEGGAINFAPVMGVAAGAVIFIIGVIILIAGTIITLLDWNRRRRGRNTTRHSFDWGR